MTAGLRAFLTKCKCIAPKLTEAYIKNLFYKIYVGKRRLLFFILTESKIYKDVC
jgi:hypothetical protein